MPICIQYQTEVSGVELIRLWPAWQVLEREEKGVFSAPPRVSFALKIPFPFQTPVTQANLSILAYFDEGVAVCLCMGGGRQTVFIL